MQNGEGAVNGNGRVSTRDVLTAVQGSEDRITHRIDRIEAKMDGHIERTDIRVSAIELARAEEKAHEKGRWSLVLDARALVAFCAMVIPAIAAAAVLL